MPAFQQCLDADPAQLMTLGADLLQAAGKLTGLGAQYGRTVAGLAASWQGDDYQGLVKWAAKVEVYIGRSDAALATAAATLESMGAAMAATGTAMKAAKQAAEAVGYKVLPSPFVILGPSQLLGHALGGSNRDPGNFVSLHNRINNPHMRGIELEVYEAVKSGKTVDCEVTPHYDGDSMIPSSITIRARSTDGALDIDETLPNSPDIDNLRTP